MKKIFILFFLVGLFNISYAAMEYSLQLQEMYKKTYQAMQVPTPDNDTIFDYAMTLTYMGKIQSAGKYLKQINKIDRGYKYQTLKELEAIEAKNPTQNWEFNMKMGLVYYFLFEDAHGKIALYNRRIDRGKRDHNQDKIDKNRKSRSKMKPIKNKYFLKSSHYFNKVAEKHPQDSMNAWGYAYRAVLHGVDNEWKDAKKLCESALEVAPDAYALHAAYMEALRQTGNFFGAVNEMRIAYAKKDEQEAYERKILGRVAQ